MKVLAMALCAVSLCGCSSLTGSTTSGSLAKLVGSINNGQDEKIAQANMHAWYYHGEDDPEDAMGSTELTSSKFPWWVPSFSVESVNVSGRQSHRYLMMRFKGTW